VTTLVTPTTRLTHATVQFRGRLPGFRWAVLGSNQ